MEITGYITNNSTYGECARVRFRKDNDGTDVLKIEDGVLYLYRDCKIIRIAKVFDIDIER